MTGWLKRRVRNWLYWTIRSAIADEMATQFNLDARTIDRHVMRRAVAETVEFLRTSGMRLEQSHSDRVALMRACLRHVMPTGMILEFGVYKGASINRLGEHFQGRAVYGFDSFVGLREPWVFGETGQFADAAGQLPKVPANVTLLKGWFEDTLPRFLAEHPGPIAFLHIDCDLYSSTACVLRLVAERIVPGTVILFDELIGYPGWQEGEYKALCEWVEATGIEFEYLGYVGKSTPGGPAEQVGIKVLGESKENTKGRSGRTAIVSNT
jgi:predicted O-methyltransferase YrrM